MDKLNVNYVLGEVGENTAFVGIRGELGPDKVTISYSAAQKGKSKAYISGHNAILATYLDEEAQKALNENKSASSKPLPNETLEKIATGEIEIVPAPIAKQGVVEQENPDYLKSGIEQITSLLKEFKIPEKGEAEWRHWAVGDQGVMIAKNEAHIR
jgi:hypothetical protein